MGIFQALLLCLNIISKILSMFEKAQADKEAEIRVTSKVRKKVDDVKKNVKKRMRAKYPDIEQ